MTYRSATQSITQFRWWFISSVVQIHITREVWTWCCNRVSQHTFSCWSSALTIMSIYISWLIVWLINQTTNQSTWLITITTDVSLPNDWHAELETDITKELLLTRYCSHFIQWMTLPAQLNNQFVSRFDQIRTWLVQQINLINHQIHQFRTAHEYETRIIHIDTVSGWLCSFWTCHHV